MSTNDQCEYLNFTEEDFPNTFFVFKKYPNEVMKVHMNLFEGKRPDECLDTDVDPIFVETLVEGILDAMKKDGLVKESSSVGYELSEKCYLSTDKLPSELMYDHTAKKAKIIADSINGKKAWANFNSHDLPSEVVDEFCGTVNSAFKKIFDFNPPKGGYSKEELKNMKSLNVAFLMKIDGTEGEG